jgi:hypothetical protein
MHGHPTLGVKTPSLGFPRNLTPNWQAQRGISDRPQRSNADQKPCRRDATRRTPWRADRKEPVERQAACLLVALRQAILNVPQTWCRRLMGLNDAAQISRILREMALSVLNEIKDLPAKVTNPEWLDEIEQDTPKAKSKAASK